MAYDPPEITNITSVNNVSTTPLLAGATYTGTGEQMGYTSIFVQVATDQDGVLYIDFSPDGSNWDTQLSFNYKAGQINPPKWLAVLDRYSRVRFENTSTTNQTELRLHTYYSMATGQLTAPLNSVVAETYDATLTRPSDYRYEVAMGKRQGRKTWNKFGFNRDVDTGAQEVIASYGGQINIMLLGDTLNVVSTDANDTALGTGARTILIIGIGVDYQEVQEVVTLNGTSTVTTLTEFIGVNRAVVLSSGSSTYNEGDINIEDSSGTVGVQAQIPAESSTTQQCIFHTQINHTLLTDWIKVNILKLSGGGGDPRVTIRGYSFSRVTLTRYEVFEVKIDTSVENTVDFSTSHPFVIQGREVLYFTAETDVNNTEVTMRFSGIEERVS